VIATMAIAGVNICLQNSDRNVFIKKPRNIYRRPNGPALSCGTDKFRSATNETSSR